MPVRNTSINKETLEDLYIIQNLSMPEITSILNISRSTVLRRVKEFGLVKSRTMQTLCNKKAFIKKYGVDNPNKSSKIITKRKQTNLQKYGTTCSLQNAEIKTKAEQTQLIRYGVKNVFQSPEIKAKIYKTNLERYGTKIPTQNSKIREKANQTNLRKYGAENVFASNHGKIQIKETMIKRYGADNPSKVKELNAKKFETKKKNQTYGKSKQEDEIYQKLSEKFKKVERQCNTEEYPFACDFYVPELKLYIEYQGFWTHGAKPFENNQEDLKKLAVWKDKAITMPSYKLAIEVWTVSDPLKRKTAKNNNLNWIEFFTLEQFYTWFESMSNIT